jgi:ribokinase
MARGRIVVVGSCNIDMYILTDNIPKPGETVLGREFQMNPGGKGANQAVAAARAGSEIFLVANVGDDVFGNQMVSNLAKERVSTDYLTLDRASSTGVAMIMVDSAGQNIIAVAPGANMALSRRHVDRAEDTIKNADYVLVQMEIPQETIEYAITLAKEVRTPVVLNAAPARAKVLSAETIAMVETLVVNESEARALTDIEVADDAGAEAAARKLQSMGAKRVVVTLGAKGALAVAKDSLYVPAREVEAVDTVGAGDAFCGALVTALAEGEEFAEAVRFANAAGALACMKVGAQSSLPSRIDIESFARE